jgi:hypothetical protein
VLIVVLVLGFLGTRRRRTTTTTSIVINYGGAERLPCNIFIV